MKYAKQGQREFLSFEYSEVTLENIKRACKVHYRGNLTTSDIFASEQGPICSQMDQIRNAKKCGRVLFHTVLYLQSAQRKV